jgi:hypothetical protein
MSCRLRRNDRAGVLHGLARAGPPGPRQWSSRTASASTRALYHWLGNALNGAGIDCGRDKIGHGLTKGDLRLQQSIVRVRQR